MTPSFIIFTTAGLLFGFEPDPRRHRDLTPDGHSFLANIREPSNWEKIKTVGHKLGCTSLPTLSNIASQVVAALIKQYLKLS